jgi:hypothetical protein
MNGKRYKMQRRLHAVITAHPIIAEITVNLRLYIGIAGRVRVCRTDTGSLMVPPLLLSFV